MPLFRKKPPVQDAVDAVQAEMTALQEDLEGFKASVEKDLSAIRKDFRELVLFLQEGPEPPEDGSNDAAETAAGQPALAVDAANVDELKGEFGRLREQVAAVHQRAESLREEVESVKATVNDESKSIRESIADAKRDISNKITYAVARLRT